MAISIKSRIMDRHHARHIHFGKFRRFNLEGRVSDEPVAALFLSCQRPWAQSSEYFLAALPRANHQLTAGAATCYAVQLLLHAWRRFDQRCIDQVQILFHEEKNLSRITDFQQQYFHLYICRYQMQFSWHAGRFLRRPPPPARLSRGQQRVRMNLQSRSRSTHLRAQEHRLYLSKQVKHWHCYCHHRLQTTQIAVGAPILG